MCFLYTRCEPCGQPVQLALKVSVEAIHYFISAITEKSKQKIPPSSDQLEVLYIPVPKINVFRPISNLMHCHSSQNAVHLSIHTIVHS